MIRAVVFDFDGVLANSEPLHFLAFRDIAAREGVTLTEAAYYTRYLGFDDAGAFRAMAADSGVKWDERQVAELIERKAERLEMLECGVSVLFPGARDAIERMSALGPVAIASGALRHEILRVLEREHLNAYFAAVVSAEDTPASKPDPAPYLRAVGLLATHWGEPLEAGECVAVEDSRWGLQSARQAGLHTIAVTHSYRADELGEADAIIGHLDMLTRELLKSLD